MEDNTPTPPPLKISQPPTTHDSADQGVFSPGVKSESSVGSFTGDAGHDIFPTTEHPNTRAVPKPRTFSEVSLASPDVRSPSATGYREHEQGNEKPHLSIRTQNPYAYSPERDFDNRSDVSPLSGPQAPYRHSRQPSPIHPEGPFHSPSMHSHAQTAVDAEEPCRLDPRRDTQFPSAQECEASQLGHTFQTGHDTVYNPNHRFSGSKLSRTQSKSDPEKNSQRSSKRSHICDLLVIGVLILILVGMAAVVVFVLVRIGTAGAQGDGGTRNASPAVAHVGSISNATTGNATTGNATTIYSTSEVHNATATDAKSGSHSSVMTHARSEVHASSSVVATKESVTQHSKEAATTTPEDAST